MYGVIFDMKYVSNVLGFRDTLLQIIRLDYKKKRKTTRLHFYSYCNMYVPL